MIKKIPMGLRGTEEIIISPKLTSHKIYLQISLSWKVNLLSREEKKRRSGII